jgi:hypothetical protein
VVYVIRKAPTRVILVTAGFRAGFGLKERLYRTTHGKERKVPWIFVRKYSEKEIGVASRRKINKATIHEKEFEPCYNLNYM